MDKRHIIEDAEFDISFDSVAAAREHEPGLAAFISERLLPLADEIFCELADDSMVARIDRLELDLGAIRCSGFHDEMESRFREKLRSLLLDKMRSLATAHSPVEGLVGRQQAGRGQLETFLETGRMPWHAERATGGTADAMLEQTLAHQGEAFAGFLKRTPHRDSVVKRLARQFSDRLLVDVMQLLAPAHAALAGELIAKLGETWNKTSAGITEKELKSLVWERLLGEHLKAGVSDPERLLRDIVKELFVRHARPADISGKRTLESEPAAAEFMYEAHDAAGRRGESPLAARQPEGRREWGADTARLRALLETAFATGDAGVLAGQWEALRDTHRELVRAVFMQRMGDDRLQQKVAGGFPETMLLELLSLLSPQDSAFMVALSGLSELRGAGGAKNPEFWHYTLGCLHGSQTFDRAAYARGLLRHMSAQVAAQRQLAQAITAIALELKEALADLPEASAADAADLAEEPVRADELYRQLVSRLKGASGGEPQFIAMLKELESTYPETHAHLLRKLQRGEIRTDVGALKMGEVRQLVVSLIRMNPESQDLLRAIGSQEHLVQDTESYYRHILDKLIRSQSVDLEAAAADNGAHEGMQAADKAEAALGRSLSERQEVRASVREEIARTIEAERADALYGRLEQRLGGTHDGLDMVPAIKRLASAYPEMLARLQRRLQAGELRGDVGTLDGREARQLVLSLIRLNSGAKESDFLRAIERYAGRAKSEAGYFRHILKSLIRNQTIDLEEAVRSHETDAHRERMHAARGDVGRDGGDRLASRHDDREKVGTEPALESAGLLRIRLEEALVLGRAERVEDVWGELLSGRADMMREVFMRRFGDGSQRTRLANGFPESMLQELVRALSPSAGRDIEMLAEMLAAQPGLRASGTPDAKNIPFWEYTLSYLHASGLRGYERSGYAQGLVHHLAEQGVSQATLQQAIARIASVWDERGDFSSHHGQADDRHEAEDAYVGTVLDGEPVRQLLRRLTVGSSSRELAQEIAELADGKPEAVREFYRQLQSGEVALDVAVLTAREARLLIAAFIAANHGRMGEDIRREIEAHAGKARDERRYYQSVLEMLVCNRVVDLEAAMAALPAETAGEGIPPVRAGTEKKTVSGSLRARFESALMQGDAGEIAGVWNDLRFNYGNMVRDVFNLRMGDDVIRRRLAERFPEAMLFELICVLAPLAGGFIQSLERQIGLQAGAARTEVLRRAAREHALSYLHEFGARGFRRADYARDLMHRMVAQGMDGNAFLRALEVVDPALAQSLRGPAPMDIEAVATEKQREPADRLRALLETAFATGDAGALSGQWKELRDTDPELVRAVFMQRVGDDRLQQKVAKGFPETMLLELLNLLSPQDSGFMVALSGLPELRGAGSAKNIEFWHYTLGYLHGSPTVDRAAYARGLLRHMSAQGVVQRQLAQALAGIIPELKEALADLPEASATGAADIAEEPAHADELYRQLVQRLGGAGGGEQQFIAMLKELESTYPETPARLLRELQCGEIGADIGALAMSEVRQLVVSLIRLNPGSQELLRVIGAREHLVQDTEGYYRHILDKLVRSQAVDIEVAVDEAAQGNESTLQKARPARGGDTFHDEEAAQARDTAGAPDEAVILARTAHLRTLLNRALLTGNAGELAGAWDELRRHHLAIVRECFERLMGDAGAQGRVAQGFPASMLAELVRILVPAESRFIETLAAQLQSGQAAGSEHRFLWQHTLGYLHAARAFDRFDYAESLSRCLSERGMDRRDIMQAVAHADAALGKALSERQGMHADTQEEIARAATIETSAAETGAVATERADELYRRVTKRLRGTSSGEPEFSALVEEMASACPEMLAHLLRQLQSGELRADVGMLDGREARQLVASLIRLNSGAKESDFLNAIERYAGRAKSEAGYYRHVLESLIRNRNIDLEEAASVLPQETARQISAADRSEENRASPGAESGDEQRPQMAEEVRPLATTGDKTMQVENTSAFDGHGAMDDSESAEEIYIANAGMVLATPYLPQLFRMLDLTEGTKFRDERAAERAIHLLQFMVNESCDSPEFLLSLNKLLCGVPTGVPIVREIELLQKEKEVIEGMLNGIIRNWTILGNTSVQGLRESFLQRSGRLQLKEDSWHLKVEPKGIDVLLDRLPWSFALIKHPWMGRPIYVEWR